MSLRRLRRVLRAYGAAPERWPERDRAAGRLTAGRAHDVVALETEARRLDRALALLPGLRPSDRLRAFIASIPAREAQLARAMGRGFAGAASMDVLTPRMPSWQPITALVTAAFLGILWGGLAAPGSLNLPYVNAAVEEPLATEMAFLAFGPEDEFGTLGGGGETP